MPDTERPYEQSFNAIVVGAIQDFNNIHKALADKGGRNLNGSALSDDATGTPSSNYPYIIRGQFWTVSAPNGSSGIINNTSFNGGSGTITNYDGSTLNVALGQSASYTQNGALSLTGRINAHGYITENTVIAYTLQGTTLNISGALEGSQAWPREEGSRYYEYTPSDGTLISKIRLDKAALSMGSQGISASDVGIDYTDTALTDVGDLRVLLNDPSGLGSDPYSFRITTATRARSRLTASTQVTVENSGYIDSAADIAGGNTQVSGVLSLTRNIGSEAGDISITGSSEDTIYIKKGSVEIGEKSGGVLTISSSELPYERDVPSQDASGYYRVDAEVSAFSYPNATISEGYFKNEAISVNGEASSDAIYVKKGSVEDASASVDLSLTNLSGLTTNATSGYTLTVSAPQNGQYTLSGPIHHGYVNDGTYTATLSGLSRTITLPKADITISNGSIGVDAVAQLAGVRNVGSSSADGYALNIDVSMPLTASIENSSHYVGGYLKGTDQIHLTQLSGAHASNQIFIGKGSASYTPILSFAMTDREGDNDSGIYDEVGSGASLATFFKTTAPESGDYWTITSRVNRDSFSEGYLKEGDETLNAGQTYYLPKAVVQWHEGGEDGEDYIQVTSAGYLPSGILENITTVEVDEASVSGVLSVPNVSIVNSALTDGLANYAIVLQKGTVDAGYISATKGDLTLADNYYIKHGAAHVVAVLGVPEPRDFHYSQATNTYDAEIGGSVSISETASTFSEGYMKAADITTAVDNSTTTTLSIDRVGMTIEHADLGDTLKPAITLTGMHEDPESEFGVSVDLSALNHLLVPKVSSTGYGATDDEDTGVALAGTGEIKIKAASILEPINGSIDVDISNNFNENTAGNYTLTPTLNPSRLTATIGEGYVPMAGLQVGVANTISVGTKTGISVPHGSVTVSGSGTSTLAGATNGSNGSIAAPLVYASQEPNLDYVRLRAHTEVSTSKALTEGYVKDGDIALTNSASDTDFFMRLVSQSYSTGTSILDPSKDAYVHTIDVDTELPIADQYTDKDFLIRLGDNAAGAKVQADLAALEKRLAGTLTDAEYSSAFGG